MVGTIIFSCLAFFVVLTLIVSFFCEWAKKRAYILISIFLLMGLSMLYITIVVAPAAAYDYDTIVESKNNMQIRLHNTNLLQLDADEKKSIAAEIMKINSDISGINRNYDNFWFGILVDDRGKDILKIPMPESLIEYSY